MISGDFSGQSEAPPTDLRLLFRALLTGSGTSASPVSSFRSLQNLAETIVSGGSGSVVWQHFGACRGWLILLTAFERADFFLRPGPSAENGHFLAHQDAADPQKWAPLLRGVLLDDHRKFLKKTRTLCRK